MTEEQLEEFRKSFQYFDKVNALINSVISLVDCASFVGQV